MEIYPYEICKYALAFRGEYATFKEAWDNCTRAGQMLAIANNLDVDMRILVTAKALCANTVRHLMIDVRSTHAIDVALLFGKGLATDSELDFAKFDASDAFYYAEYTARGKDYSYPAMCAAGSAFSAMKINPSYQHSLAADRAAGAVRYPTAAYASARFNADSVVWRAVSFAKLFEYVAPGSSRTAAYARVANAEAAAATYPDDLEAMTANELETANICREILTEEIFKKLNIMDMAKYNLYKKVLSFSEEYPTFKETWNKCSGAGYMLLVAGKLNVNLNHLIMANAMCANTVRHLMTDERSINAIDVAMSFAKGKATREELNMAAKAAADAINTAIFNGASTYTISALRSVFIAVNVYVDVDSIPIDDPNYLRAKAAHAAADAKAYTSYVSTSGRTPSYAADAAYAEVEANADTAIAAVDTRNVARATSKAYERETARICREILRQEVFKALNIFD